jgi:hypothetical protein
MEDKDSQPGPDSWARPATRSSRRPRWALPALAAGLLCSAVIGWQSVDYFGRLAAGEPPSVMMLYTIALLPLLAIGLALMVPGSVAAVRPWSTRRPWLSWVVASAVVAWFLIMLQGPALLFARPV